MKSGQETEKDVDKLFILRLNENTDNGMLPENEPFTLSLVDEDGTVAETYIKKKGEMVRVEESTVPESTKPMKQTKNIKAKEKSVNLEPEGKKSLDKILEQKNYSCCFCDTMFSDSKLYQEHFSQHHSSTSEMGIINRHIMQVHKPYETFNIANEKFHICTRCGKKFHEMSCLQAHMCVHTPIGNFKCKYCDYSHIRGYKIKQRMVKRVKTQHFPIQPHQCAVCGFKTSRKEYLKRHIKIQHWIYMCAECDYSFSTNGDLMKHICIHS